MTIKKEKSTDPITCMCGGTPEIKTYIGPITKEHFLELVCPKCKYHSQIRSKDQKIVIDSWNHTIEFELSKRKKK